MDDRLILEEFELRRVQQAQGAAKVGLILDELFAQQQDFVADKSRNKGALCTRRAGKTEMWPRYALKVALENPRSLIRVWAINKQRAKELLWEPLRFLCARHEIKWVYPGTSETTQTIRLENGSEIRLLGADKDKEAQKKRGDKTILEIVLEAQNVGSFLRKLVEEVIEPCTMDLKGTICLEGTPGPICTGYWYAVSGQESILHKWESKGVNVKEKDGANSVIGAGWSMHHWSVLDNPHLPHMRDDLRALKVKRNWADDNPTYIREWLGRWVNDLSALFYKFDPVRNVYNPPPQPWGPGWQHVLGWDLGGKDDMALVAWGWHPSSPKLYEAFSWKKPGALAIEVMAQISALEAKGFNFIKKVADTGGGGKMYVEDVMTRYSQVFEPAQKTNKYEHVRLMNDDLLTGFVQLQEGSEYAEEVVSLARDPDWPPEDNPDAPPREDPRCANHCSDAGLYSYRAAYHFLHIEEKPKAKIGTKAWQADVEKSLEDADLQEHAKEWWDDVELAETPWDQ